MEKLNLIKIPGKGSYKRTSIEPKQFERLFKGGLTKKKLLSDYGLGHRVWTYSMENLNLSDKELETLRRKKITKTRAKNSTIKWQDRAKIIEQFFPGLILLVENNNYEEALKTLIKANDTIYDLKEAVRLVLKHLRHGAKRRNISINLVANALEYKVKRVLDKMGLNYKCQFRIGKRFYDFKIKGKKVLIEVDGKQYHSKASNKEKDNIAKSKGYFLIRIKEKDIKYVNYIKDKINKAIGA
jgi:very-short-patch-repair endonuclease